MLLIAYGIDAVRFGELRGIISQYCTIRDAESEDDVLRLLAADPGHVLAVMFSAEMITAPGFSLAERHFAGEHAALFARQARGFAGAVCRCQL